MKISILCVGKPKNKHIEALAAHYFKRIRAFFPIMLEHVPEPKDPLPAQRIEKEGERLLRMIGDRDFVVALDECGESLDSRAFSERFRTSIEKSAGRVVLVIGGAFGLSEAIRARSDVLLSLSPMTMPHELCLLFLMEQVYRACTLMHGVEYHH